MRYLALLLLLAAPALAATPERYLYEAQALTRAAPTLSTEGMSLTTGDGMPIRGFWISICADSGQTLSGAGDLRVWTYNGNLSLWMRNPLLDKAITATVRCQNIADVPVAYFGTGRRVLYAADGVTVSSGTVTVNHEGSSTP